MEMRPCGLSDMDWHGLARVGMADKRRCVAALAGAQLRGRPRRGFCGLGGARFVWHQLGRGSRNCTGAMHWLQAVSGAAACSGGAIGLGAKTPHANIPRSPARGSLLALGSDIIWLSRVRVDAGTCLRPCVSPTERIFSHPKEQTPRNFERLPASTNLKFTESQQPTGTMDSPGLPTPTLHPHQHITKLAGFQC